MTYRLLCIYETIGNASIPQLRIEVNLDGKSTSLAPFQRKVTLNDLLADASTNGLQPSALCQLINHAGLNSQPFCIDSRLISHPLVQRILVAHPFSYVKATPKSSLKRISSPSSIIHSSSIVPHLTSSVPSGILYIDNPASWHRNIKVRFRYNDALSDFYPSYSPLPYLSNLGMLMQRNEQEETRLLDMLGEDYNPATATLSLNTTDTERLAELTKKGWTLYVSSPNKAASRLYFHHESSGINWFSTDQDVNQSEFAHQLLDGYLHHRNYHEYDGHIILFKKEDATQSDDKTLAQQLDASIDVRKLFAETLPLTEAEIHDVKSSITNRLHATLRPYQLDGVMWLQQQRKNNHGCLLADEMGLGKTIQIIAHLCCLGNDRHHLIIAPTSLIYNWKDEVSRFAPQISKQLTFVSYDMLRIHLSDYLPEYYDTIIIDEAQVIKNRQTKKYQAISQLHCKQPRNIKPLVNYIANTRLFLPALLLRIPLMSSGRISLCSCHPCIHSIIVCTHWGSKQYQRSMSLFPANSLNLSSFEEKSKWYCKICPTVLRKLYILSLTNPSESNISKFTPLYSRHSLQDSAAA